MKKLVEFLTPLGQYVGQVFIAVDQLINALWPSFLWGHLSYADETLSARCYRAHRDGKRMGIWFMKFIDLLFTWQGPGHCKNAYLKELDRRGVPPEYRVTPPT
jgi:hypothetical protein